MKNFILSLVAVSFLTLSSFCQLTEGHFVYKIDMTTDNPDMQMAIGMLQGSTLEMHFKEKNARVEMKMGAMMNITTITNETSGKILMLMSGMIGKNAIASTFQEMEEASPEKPEFTVELVDESKTIEGFNCKKAILTDEEGTATVYWYTEEIMVSKKGQKYINENIPGFPMEFELNNNGLKMTMTVTKFEKKLDKKADKLFDMTIPEGYTTMTMEELNKMGM